MSASTLLNQCATPGGMMITSPGPTSRLCPPSIDDPLVLGPAPDDVAPVGPVGAPDPAHRDLVVVAERVRDAVVVEQVGMHAAGHRGGDGDAVAVQFPGAGQILHSGHLVAPAVMPL